MVDVEGKKDVYEFPYSSPSGSLVSIWHRMKARKLKNWIVGSFRRKKTEHLKRSWWCWGKIARALWAKEWYLETIGQIPKEYSHKHTHGSISSVSLAFSRRICKNRTLNLMNKQTSSSFLVQVFQRRSVWSILICNLWNSSPLVTQLDGWATQVFPVAATIECNTGRNTTSLDPKFYHADHQCDLETTSSWVGALSALDL